MLECLLSSYKGTRDAYLEESSRCDDDHETIRQILDFFIQAFISILTTNARTALERVCDEHAVVGEKPTALDDVVAAATDERRADNADDLSEKIVVLLQSTRVGAVDLELGVGREEA